MVPTDGQPLPVGGWLATAEHELGDAHLPSMTEALTPSAYERWRSTSIGAMVKQLEARLMAHFDPKLARFGTFGAAFLCLASPKPTAS